VLGISSVSGGSLGAAVYLAELNAQSSPAKSLHREKMLDALTADFLGSALGGMFFLDFTQHLLPLGFPDRAEALERSWESAWGKDGLEKGFLAQQKTGELPYLFLNSTDAITGRRVIHSPLVVAGALPEVLDYFEVSPDDIRLSTAAMNSARFTYLSPGGVVHNNDSVALRLVDGGYFENYGADTAIDILLTMWKDKTKQSNFRPVVIQIVSDPELNPEDEPKLVECSTDMGTAEPDPEDGNFDGLASETLTPVNGLMKTREARGLLATKRLACLTDRLQGKYFMFRMKPRPVQASVIARVLGAKKDGVHPPLGWLMGGQTRTQIQDQLSKDCATRETMKRLVTLLSTGVDLEFDCSSKVRTDENWDSLKEQN
jgi:hypothetical protein